MKTMKLIAAVSLLIVASAQVCLAQKYSPKDTWPYVNQEFLDGALRTSDGKLVKNAKMNVSVLDGKLHYVENDVIMALDMTNVYTARIGDKAYVNVEGKMMKVLAENDRGAVVSETVLDKDQLSKSDIGYGISSATASTQNITSLLSQGADMVNMNLMTAMKGRGEGNDIPVLDKIYLRVGMTVVPASKKDVMALPSVGASAAKAFFKSNKIKWNDPESLLQVVSFISEQESK